VVPPNWSDTVNGGLANFRVRNHVGREVTQEVSQMFRDVVEGLHKATLAKLEGYIVPGSTADDLLEGVFEVQKSFGASDIELRELRKSTSYIKPVKRYLGSGTGTDGQQTDYWAYDAPFNETMEQMFKYCPGVWDDVQAFTEKMRSGSGLRADEAYDPNMVLSDITDGSEFGRFMAKVNLGPNEVPLVFIFYYDGLEVVNGLGQARTTHELACFYWALVDINKVDRLKHANMRLATVCLKKAVSVVGADAVINGVEGRTDQANAWGATMKRLDNGIQIETPEGEWIECRGGMAVVAADTPAAAQLTGTKEAVGPTTQSICRACHCS